MATMTHRTTFTLDETSAVRLARLASRWKVSKAEVVRRSLAQAESNAQTPKMEAVAMLRRLHEKGGGIDPKKAEAYLAEVYEDRKRWRGK